MTLFLAMCFSMHTIFALHRMQSSWDTRGQNIFDAWWLESLRSKQRKVILPILHTEITVVDDIKHASFWSQLQSHQWELATLETFMKFIDGRTTVVDFGAWIGPTVLFHSLLSKKTYAIEGDPAAFALLKTNVALNRARSAAYANIELIPAVIGTNHTVLEMHSAEPGNSCSGLGAVACGAISASWSVQALRLPDLFAQWRLPVDSDIFIKIDIESYECQLVPTFLHWLGDSKQKPTFFIAMHAASIASCSADQYADITLFIRSFSSYYCAGSGGPVFAHGTDTILCATGEIVMTDRTDGV